MENEIKNILNNPSDYIDSERFFSWERFFTYLLINKTADTYLKYSKSKLNPSFLQGKNYNQILEVLPDVVKK